MKRQRRRSRAVLRRGSTKQLPKAKRPKLDVDLAKDPAKAVVKLQKGLVTTLRSCRRETSQMYSMPADAGHIHQEMAASGDE